MPYFTLKWTEDDPSNSLILTYRARWQRQILKGEFSFEFRKTGPNNMVPDLAYIYLTDPIQAIVARFPVKARGQVPLKEALALSKRSLLTTEELRSYAGARSELYFYEFGAVEVAKQIIKNSTLASEYGYFPSANFFPLSQKGCHTLARLGQF